jgi:hypothetical protein
MSANLVISDSFVLGFVKIACCGVQRGVSEHLVRNPAFGVGLAYRATIKRFGSSKRATSGPWILLGGELGVLLHER